MYREMQIDGQSQRPGQRHVLFKNGSNGMIYEQNTFMHIFSSLQAMLRETILVFERYEICSRARSTSTDTHYRSYSTIPFFLTSSICPILISYLMSQSGAINLHHLLSHRIISVLLSPPLCLSSFHHRLATRLPLFPST